MEEDLAVLDKVHLAEAHGAAPRDWITRATEVARDVAGRAQDYDIDGAYPSEGIAALHGHGLLVAPLPSSAGGDGFSAGAPDVLRAVLGAIGGGSLALGRLFEGHVNAIGLVVRYGNAANLAKLRDEAKRGRISGVWMAGEPLRLERHASGGYLLRGRKVLCSGAGHIRRPLVAAEHAGGSLMCIPHLPLHHPIDVSAWTAQGMRATATGTVDFDGIPVSEDDIVGAAGDYLRSPFFRGGAWRVLAVQLGGLEAAFDAYKAQLATSPHRDHPIQLARLGEATIACETARLWVRRAAALAEGDGEEAEAVDAYVDLARNAFEEAALRLCAHVQKAIGLKALLRPNPLERILRDLTTYLRQPALDASLMSAAAFELQRSGA